MRLFELQNDHIDFTPPDQTILWLLKKKPQNYLCTTNPWQQGQLNSLMKLMWCKWKLLNSYEMVAWIQTSKASHSTSFFWVWPGNQIKLMVYSHFQMVFPPSIQTEFHPSCPPRPITSVYLIWGGFDIMATREAFQVLIWKVTFHCSDWLHQEANKSAIKLWN